MPRQRRTTYRCIMQNGTRPSDALYAQILARDPSLDGHLFNGVTSTGIYCRPVCRARVPFQKNLLMYVTAAAAEAAGFRPCLRCRPEAAPFYPAWNGTKSTVARALRMIEEGALDHPSRGQVPDLADRLGVGARHLNRLFQTHLGASPVQVAQTLRVQRAKRLLAGTDLMLDEIAAQSGFASARRMRAAFSTLYGQPPSALRRKPSSK